MNNIVFSHFDKYPELRYGFSEKGDGSMHWRFDKENRIKYFHKVGIDPAKVVTAGLVHGTKVVVAQDSVAGTIVEDADALVTNTKNLFISVTGADCFSLYFYDPKTHTIGIAHVGWRGLVGGLVQNTIDTMKQSFASVSEDLLVGIGPGIRKCHFAIKPENAAQYKNYPKYIIKRNDGVQVDLPGIIMTQLKECGLNDENIEDSGMCTYCHEKEFFSYRRDMPKNVQPILAYIGLPLLYKGG